MIVFDLDNTLADTAHRQHFVTPFGYSCDGSNRPVDCDGQPFKPDWKSFFEACGEDAPIKTVINLFRLISVQYDTVEIWSGRCESVRGKTLNWLVEHIQPSEKEYFDSILKMRPIGDYSPDDQLKEYWLDLALKNDREIEFVVDDRKKVIEMYRRRGIFVFDVSQGKGDF